VVPSTQVVTAAREPVGETAGLQAGSAAVQKSFAKSVASLHAEIQKSLKDAKGLVSKANGIAAPVESKATAATTVAREAAALRDSAKVAQESASEPGEVHTAQHTAAQAKVGFFAAEETEADTALREKKARVAHAKAAQAHHGTQAVTLNAFEDWNTQLIALRSSQWASVMNNSAEVALRWQKKDDLRLAAEDASFAGKRKRYATDGLDFAEAMYKPYAKSVEDAKATSVRGKKHEARFKQDVKDATDKEQKSIAAASNAVARRTVADEALAQAIASKKATDKDHATKTAMAAKAKSEVAAAGSDWENAKVRSHATRQAHDVAKNFAAKKTAFDLKAIAAHKIAHDKFLAIQAACNEAKASFKANKTACEAAAIDVLKKTEAKFKAKTEHDAAFADENKKKGIQTTTNKTHDEKVVDQVDYKTPAQKAAAKVWQEWDAKCKKATTYNEKAIVQRNMMRTKCTTAITALNAADKAHKKAVSECNNATAIHADRTDKHSHWTKEFTKWNTDTHKVGWEYWNSQAVSSTALLKKNTANYVSLKSKAVKGLAAWNKAKEVFKAAGGSLVTCKKQKVAEVALSAKKATEYKTLEPFGLDLLGESDQVLLTNYYMQLSNYQTDLLHVTVIT